MSEQHPAGPPQHVPGEPAQQLPSGPPQQFAPYAAPQQFAPIPQPGAEQGAPQPVYQPVAHAAPATTLSDGEWHRMHPLTPLLKGGLVLIVVVGMVIANLRDRLIGIFVPGFSSTGDSGEWSEYSGDPIDFVVNNNLVVLALVGVLILVLLFIAGFYLSWRFHSFRITDNAVEVRKGILSRSQRRAPLDRVQGVNLTRPFFARLIGLAKLEVVGAGTDANVMLEYLATSKAEGVRSDILTRASGMRYAKAQAAAEAQAPAAAKSFGERFAQTVANGATGIVMGAEAPVAPASVVNIPLGRLIGSHLVSGTTVALLVVIFAIIVISIFASPYALFGLLPALIGLGAFWVSSLLKVLRYSIAPTPDGVRVTFGLTTTVTEIIPPGRVHAIQISQPLLWRPFGWYTLRINRMSGKSAQQQQSGTSDPFTTILPVGTWEDARRVLRLMTPEITDDQAAFLLHFGLRRVQGEDPFTTTPRRAVLFHPVSWKRNGFFLAPDTLAMRRGRLSRQVALFPLARAQSLSIRQGPIERLFKVGNLQVNAVPGTVNTVLTAVDRDALLEVFEQAAANAVATGRADHSHRWAEHASAAPSAGAPAMAQRYTGVVSEFGQAPAPHTPVQHGAVPPAPQPPMPHWLAQSPTAPSTAAPAPTVLPAQAPPAPPVGTPPTPAPAPEGTQHDA